MQVPYRELERAEREARERFPHAHRVHALLANGRPLVEVWSTPHHARVWMPEWAR